jgi:hypothetical protein
MVLDEKQLIALEEQARLDLDAIQRIRGMMARQNGAKPNVQPPPPGEDEVEDFRDYDDDSGEYDGKEATTLIGTIAKTINADPGKKWTTAKVLAHLQSTGYPLKAAKPLYSVGQSLGKLVEQGKIRILRRGLGSKPNIYGAGAQTDPVPRNL